MNIVYINHYAGSVIHGMEFRPYYLASQWVKAGHQVTIIAANYSHIRKHNVEIPTGQNYLVEIIDGINYIWCRTPKYNGNGLKRVLNIFTFLYRVRQLIPVFKNKNTSKLNGLEQVNFNVTIDTVIASSTYPFDIKVAQDLAKLNNARLIYEVHDLWPLTPIEVGGMSPKHPFIWLMQRAEDYAYRNADKVVSLLPNAYEYMQQHGMRPEKFVYIPNGIVTQQWLSSTQKIPNQHQILFSRLRDIENKFIIGYAGGMGEANALGYLLDAAKLVIDKPIAIVMVGDGINREELILRISNEQLINVYILPAIDKSQIPDFLGSCDALYIGWHNLPIYRFGVSPNKLFDYMLAKKPIIHSISLANDLVSEANCGVSVAAGDVHGIASAISAVSQLKAKDRQNLGQNGYNFVLSNHDYRVLATRFSDKCFNQ